MTTARWTMIVDEDRCTGCQACVVACYAENNVPVVGEKEVAYGRGMHWIRVERAWEGEYPDLRVTFRPVMCQQCSEAPCEPVCPVFATYHNEDGLNAQIYPRCIGTRYCGSACPYKVRAFNWFDPDFPEPLNEQLNPDVTVRRRGIMEKCTFCLQRIRRASEDARYNGRQLRDGDVQPACVRACPTSALRFGDMDDPASEVRVISESRRGSRLLEELGTGPAVIYLARGESDVSG